MKLFDTHMHTYYSSDSKMNPKDAIDKAKSIGLSGICFTDHYDYKYPDYDFDIDLNKRHLELDPLKSLSDNSFSIFIGIEIGLRPYDEFVKATYDKIRGFEFDQIIGSTHIINGVDPYAGKYYIGKSKFVANQTALIDINNNIDKYNDFDVLGHFDYHTRYASFDDSRLYYKDHADLFDEIFRKIISRGIALEINTKTYYYNSIDSDILKRYKELGGEMISFGSDAHEVETIGRLFNEHALLVKSLGFDYIVHFEKRKPVFVKI